MLSSYRWLLVILLLGSTAGYSQTDAKSAALKEFDKQLKSYAELHNKIDQSLSPADKEADPKVIRQREIDFAALVRAARSNAAPGDIFVPGIRPILVAIIKQETAGTAGKKSREMILGEGNPRAEGAESNVELKINGPYPSTAPRSTMPPPLLLQLPPLPDALEYRFVGHNLILLDPKANLIVDILPGAIS